jgi:hypothetical protein
MDLESKAFKIALKEIPKEYKMDEKKVFNTKKAIPKTDRKPEVSLSGTKVHRKNKKIIPKKKPKKKNISNRYKSK